MVRIQEKCLINVQTVASALLRNRIYNGINEHIQGRGHIGAVIAINVLMISQIYRDIKGYILGKSLTSVLSVTCVLASRGILSSIRKRTMIREEVHVIKAKDVMQTMFMKGHSNVQNVAKAFYVQQISKAIKEHILVRSPISVHSVINVLLVYHMYTDT